MLDELRLKSKMDVWWTNHVVGFVDNRQFVKGEPTLRIQVYSLKKGWYTPTFLFFRAGIGASSINPNPEGNPGGVWILRQSYIREEHKKRCISYLKMVVFHCYVSLPKRTQLKKKNYQAELREERCFISKLKSKVTKARPTAGEQ